MEAYFNRYTGKDLSAAEEFARLSEILQGFRPKFQAPTLLNSWVAYGGGYTDPGFYKDPWERVHLVGMVKNGTTFTSAIFTLPPGYRPLKPILFPSLSNGVPCRIDILANGTVQANATPAGGSNAWVSLNGISFAAEQ